MRHRTTSYDKSYVGSSSTALKSDNVRKPPTDEPSNVTRAAGTVLAGMMAGLSHREAVDLAAITALAGIACAKNPEMADAIKARLYATTINYVVAKRVRAAR